MEFRNEAETISFVPWTIIAEQMLLDNFPYFHEAYWNRPPEVFRDQMRRLFREVFYELLPEAITNPAVYGSMIGIVVPVRRYFKNPESPEFVRHLIGTLAHETLHWVSHKVDGV